MLNYREEIEMAVCVFAAVGRAALLLFAWSAGWLPVQATSVLVSFR